MSQQNCVPLGSVVSVEKTKSRGLLPYVGLEDISSNTGEFTGSTLPAQVKSDTFYFTPRHVLYGRLRAYLNKALLPTFEGHCSTEIFPLLPCERLDRNFLFHWLTWSETCERIAATATGARMPRANMNEVMEFEIPLPQLEEQKRIVAVLDQAFAALDRARAHAEANLVDANELLRSVQITAAANHKDWITAEISTIIKVRSGDFLPSKAMAASGTIPVFGGNGQTGLHNESNLKGRNILIGRVGAKCGNVRVVDGPIWLTDNAFHVSKLYRDFDLDFLALLLSKADLRTTANQAAQPAISGTTIGVVKVRFPDSIEDQRRHVMRVRSIETKTLELVEAYERKLSELTTLRQSLLQKAFSGELA
ncbi:MULTISPECIES: restriction endonuclease subunit S [Rhodanobacter]|nr:restriction endonuclease subunit S [Rhodanobacter spathiphylli]